MYCIRKFADCWAVYNLDNEQSRPLTEEERQTVEKEIASLKDPMTLAHYTDRLECLEDLP
ncbi:MAG: hypothetical protein P4L51_06170 [Puia sp.]|nr:hypothetical protein [Puia sp.]